ncbi:hypothetical protein acsn021_35420 [Anaerocolumna cellulosilytica]|uniref:Uncharacterized protein n=1 Tax=Anaerocolumna cellulosilytica TaxID=433286 RepID=A0A6S6QXP0_9FIRM|nr:ABC-2 family transporter protein [Anaerocolumna cellulosilytica]MBB5195441.1 ABC-2 type transport system permease protein [Anaerocolumna cellulosilytica]BCJ95973.1 hypothetical protein acsn021_35420 [Anaerocolumna cellulosilytica]
MLMEARNQLKVILLSVKYNIMREMTNRTTFVTNIFFMILNNSTFIVQWLILFRLKNNVGGYAFDEVMTLWGFGASTFGIAHIFFRKAFELPDLIINGKLDAFLVQPKSVLLGVITSATSTSAIGDVIYGYIILVVFNFSIRNLCFFTLFTITGGIILTAFAVITGSLSFWLVRADILSNNLMNVMVSVSTYPDGIFKGIVRLLLYTVIPTGFAVYLPVRLMVRFRLDLLLGVLGFTAAICSLAGLIFYKGLKRYASSSLMSARI